MRATILLSSPSTRAFLRLFKPLCHNKAHFSIYLFASSHPNSNITCIPGGSFTAPSPAFRISPLQCSLPKGAKAMFLFKNKQKTLLRCLGPGHTLDFIYYLFFKIRGFRSTKFQAEITVPYSTVGTDLISSNAWITLHSQTTLLEPDPTP